MGRSTQSDLTGLRAVETCKECVSFWKISSETKANYNGKQTHGSSTLRLFYVVRTLLFRIFRISCLPNVNVLESADVTRNSLTRVALPCSPGVLWLFPILNDTNTYISIHHLPLVLLTQRMAFSSEKFNFFFHVSSCEFFKMTKIAHTTNTPFHRFRSLGTIFFLCRDRSLAFNPNYDTISRKIFLLPFYLQSTFTIPFLSLFIIIFCWYR
jgi:hypothetical protein